MGVLVDWEQKQAAEVAAWSAIHELAAGTEPWLRPWRYTYRVDDLGTRLEGELPTLPWMPEHLQDILRRGHEAALSAGLPGLLSVEVHHWDGGEPRDAQYLVGVVAADQMWFFALCNELVELDAELRRSGCTDEWRTEQLVRLVAERLFHPGTAPITARITSLDHSGAP